MNLKKSCSPILSPWWHILGIFLFLSFYDNKNNDDWYKNENNLNNRDIQISDKLNLMTSTEIYYAQKQNEAAAVTNHGTENLRGVMKNGRQKAINYVNNMLFS